MDLKFTKSNHHCQVFYVRNHLPVPDITDVEAFRVEVESDFQGDATVQHISLSVKDLKEKYQKHVNILHI